MGEARDRVGERVACLPMSRNPLSRRSNPNLDASAHIDRLRKLPMPEFRYRAQALASSRPTAAARWSVNPSHDG